MSSHTLAPREDRGLHLVAAFMAAMLGACAQMPADAPPLPLRQAGELRLAESALAPAAWPDERWWEVFGDAQLDRLVEAGLAGAPSLDLAVARVREAQQAQAAALAAGGPGLAGNAMIEREKLTGTGLIPPPYRGVTVNEGRATLDFNYELDWWNRNRQLVAAAVSRTRAAEAEAAGARLLLSIGLAQAYFLYQSDLRRRAAARDLLERRESLLKLASARLASGLDPIQPRRQSEADIASSRLNLAQIDASLALGRNQLAALLGRGPGDLPQIEAAPLPTAKPGLPANLTIDLVGRRPDIQAQRWRVEAGARQIDVAKAQFYPDLNVAAFLGFASIGFGNLLKSGSEIAGVAPALHLPLFDSGRLSANLGSSRAALDSAIAQYNQTVVDAVRQVADQADTLASIDAQDAAVAESLQTAQRLLAFAESRYRAGLADFTGVLAAQSAVLLQSDLQAQLAGRKLTAQVALIKALGGGYQSARSVRGDAAAQRGSAVNTTRSD